MKQFVNITKPVSKDDNLLGGGVSGHDIFEKIISLNNLFSAWKEFKKGKTGRLDVDKNFIYDSYSCRLGGGTHLAVNRLEKFIAKLSGNNRRTIYALKCDIRKFFDSVDKEILLGIIKRKIKDNNSVKLISIILNSFSKEQGKGLPLGNVTSQLFANIYLNELDQYIKHQLRVKYYLRYCDDFVILSEEPYGLLELAFKIGEFLEEFLILNLHPNKVILRKYKQGVDFLGYVVLPYHRALRTKTKRRTIRKIIEKRDEFNDDLVSQKSFRQSLNSFLGMLSHCNGYELEKEIIWLSGLAEVEI